MAGKPLEFQSEPRSVYKALELSLRDLDVLMTKIGDPCYEEARSGKGVVKIRNGRPYIVTNTPLYQAAERLSSVLECMRKVYREESKARLNIERGKAKLNSAFHILERAAEVGDHNHPLIYSPELRESIGDIAEFWGDVLEDWNLAGMETISV